MPDAKNTFQDIALSIENEEADRTLNSNESVNVVKRAEMVQGPNFEIERKIKYTGEPQM